MSAFIDIAGRKFERLTVISRAASRRGRAYWNCQCDCGNRVEVESYQLRRGIAGSCGCIKLERTTKHGLSSTAEYQAFHDMLQRCYRSTHPSYKDYGARGITVCSRWRDDFLAFYADMGKRPADTSLDRIDNQGNYSPENCQWSTREVQIRNRRANVFLTYQGRTLCVSDWSRELGIHKDTIRYRLKQQWPIQAVLNGRAA